MNDIPNNAGEESAPIPADKVTLTEAQLNTDPVAAVSTSNAKQKPQYIGQSSVYGGVSILSETTGTGENLTEGPTANPNVSLLLEYTSPLMNLEDRKDLNGSREMMSFLAERGEGVDERIRAFVSPKALQTGRGYTWNKSIILAASTAAYFDNRFETTLQREGAKFMQYLNSENGKIGFTAPKPNEPGVGTYTGEKAMHRIRSILGLAGQCSIPLFHSGFWITLEAPQDSEVIELHRRIMEEKIELGRETYGLVFANEQSYINSFLLEFCLEHVHSHTVRVDSIQDLRPLIKIQDLNILFWGMACLIWPRGFDYNRALMTKEGIENTQTVSAKINIGKLLWVDNASFDEKQCAHFANRQRYQMTVDSVKEYQRTFIPSLAAGRRILLREGLEVMIASTDVNNYINDGADWISGIIQTVDSTFTQSAPDERSRNRMIDTHARASRLRNYGSWIKAIIIDGQENNDRGDIANTLNLLSTDEEISERLAKEVTKFIDDSTRALIAIPETNGVQIELPLFPNLIPIDVINTFFTLLAQRVGIIANR